MAKSAFSELKDLYECDYRQGMLYLGSIVADIKIRLVLIKFCKK